ncbi:DUF5694 domain-containing protein [Chitinophaga caseinilytica]|uniref:DUF5694 domain-containing protein n=1 Tax=Chitinophaga caseinilytica TaxID=2267521 RepID=A0ABZ2YY84_9BACT
MKHFIFIIFFISINTYAQQVDVMLIGVSHNYSKYPAQDFSGIHNKIRKFQPDAFFGEFLSKEDERLVMDYWCKQDNINRLNMLRNNRNIAAALLPGTIDSLRKLSLSKPQDYRLKTDLAHAYYLDQDVANGHYQFWQVFIYLQQTPDAELENYVNKLLSPQLDTTGRSMKRLKTSEYALIAFPMMREMGMQELLSMDCQDYDLNWGASWVAFDTKFNVFKKDTNTALRAELQSGLDKINAGYDKYANIEKTSKNVTEWLNTDDASAISASGDFYLAELYDMENFPNEEMLSKIHWWIMRNKGMCENVVNRARKAGAKRVVVLAGANHRKYMQDIFNTMPNVRVRNINEFK